ncbi:MAG: hypothetical protein ACXABO_12015 [Promethearchaeota archaeon]|jgi:hypothetical protein
MSIIPTVENEQMTIQKFIDWDKCKNVFYNNIYLEDCKIVLKMPLIPEKNLDDDIKIKKFDLTKYTFLINY